jgi:hypothetical protein
MEQRVGMRPSGLPGVDPLCQITCRNGARLNKTYEILKGLDLFEYRK